MKLVALGLGYSAKAALRRIAPASAVGTTRSPEKAAEHDGFARVELFDGGTASAGLSLALAEASHLLVSIPPAEDGEAAPSGGDPVLAVFTDDLRRSRDLKSVVYLSTVGVYGDTGGAWVDETSPLDPSNRRTRARVRAEAAWQAFGKGTGVPVAILRLAGIYGPGRNPFVALAAGRARRIVKPGQVFNRVHVDDIAAAIDLAFSRRAAGVFDIADGAPAPPQDVVAYAAALMGVAPPPEEDFAAADLSPMARSFYEDNRRVANERSRTVLGLAYAHPDYRAGLSRMWSTGTWR